MTMKVTSSLVVALMAAGSYVSKTEAFSVGSLARHRRPCASGGLHAAVTAADAVTALADAQAATVDRIAAAIPDLGPKPDLSWNAGDVTIDGRDATLDGRDAAGPANVAWLASATVAGRLSSLTVFNGPLTDVPHLLSRCLVTGDGDDAALSLALDFRPRGYGAYELADPETGAYPGPETLGRDAFTYSGNRKDYDGKFGTEEVQAFLEATVASFEGDVSLVTDDLNEFDRLTAGPLLLRAVVPLTEANVAAAIAAREKAADYWLSWALDTDTHAHRPGAPINSQYVYDSKYRQNAYSGLLPVYTGAFGAADGGALSAAESGPLDEGYVGGGS